MTKLTSILVLLVALLAASANAQTTAFTYQGKLSDGANSAPTGSYDLQFTLWDAASGGTQQPQPAPVTVTRTGVSVAGGVFTVSLNFTAAAFDGAARYVQISVKRPADASYTDLMPRQPVTSAPYAIRALNASNVEVTTAGNSIVNSINNAATNQTISSARLAADVVRLKPSASQVSTTTDGDAAMLDLTGTVTSQNNAAQTTRFRLNHTGAFGVFKDAANLSNPIIKLNADAGFLVGGNYDAGFSSSFGIPAEGSGTRMMWYPGKAAFRAGYVNGTQWDDANIGSYSVAFGQNARASGGDGFAAGKFSTAANVGSVAIGEGTTASGANSVALGYGAHTNARQGSFVFADRSVPLIYDGNGNLDANNSDFLRAGVNNSANWRVSGGFRIFTSSNLSTGVTIQSGAATSNWGQANAVISTSTGAYLSTGGVWTNASSRDLKINFAAVNARDVLRRVLSLPIQTWNYKAENASVKHIGAMSQDFSAAFNLGGDARGIATVDADGVALAAIQGLNEELNEQTKKLRAETAALQSQVAAQAAQFDEFEVRMKRLEQRSAKPRRTNKRRK